MLLFYDPAKTKIHDTLRLRELAIRSLRFSTFSVLVLPDTSHEDERANRISGRLQVIVTWPGYRIRERECCVEKVLRDEIASV